MDSIIMFSTFSWSKNIYNILYFELCFERYDFRKYKYLCHFSENRNEPGTFLTTGGLATETDEGHPRKLTGR
jgi:hypothetical protein